MMCPWCTEDGKGAHKTIAQTPHRGLLRRKKGYYCYKCHRSFTVLEHVRNEPFSKRRRPATDSTLDMFAS